MTTKQEVFNITVVSSEVMSHMLDDNIKPASKGEKTGADRC